MREAERGRRGGARMIPVTVNALYFYAALTLVFWVGYWRGKKSVKP